MEPGDSMTSRELRFQDVLLYQTWQLAVVVVCAAPRGKAGLLLYLSRRIGALLCLAWTSDVLDDERASQVKSPRTCRLSERLRSSRGLHTVP